MRKQLAAAMAGVVALAGCVSILGLEGAAPEADVSLDASSEGGGSGTVTSGSSGFASSASSSSSSGSTGETAVPWRACTSLEQSPCPLDPCGVGTFTCTAEGTGYGACTGTSATCTGAIGWSNRFGNTAAGASNETVTAAAGADGATYFIGSVKTNIDFDGQVVTPWSPSRRASRALSALSASPPSCQPARQPEDHPTDMVGPVKVFATSFCFFFIGSFSFWDLLRGGDSKRRTRFRR